MTMSEVVLIEAALPASEMTTAASHEISQPDDAQSPPEEPPIPHEVPGDIPGEAPEQETAPAEGAAVVQDSIFTDEAASKAEPKIVPQPVTLEDDPESPSANEPVLATQTPEPAQSGAAPLTPKLPVLDTTASPTTTEANGKLSPLPDTPVDSVEPGPQLEPSAQSPDIHVAEVQAIQKPVPRAISHDVSLPVQTALSFLDADSPPVTKEAIRQSTLNATRRSHPSAYNASPSSYSHSSVGSATYTSDVFSRADHGVESDATWSATGRYSLKGDGLSPPGQHHAPEFHRSWTSPEARMPPPPMSHISGSPSQSRFPQPSPFPFSEHVPPSGYQLVATKLAGDLGGMQVKPIYRRFEALNHRLLLSLQDEIQHLEEQLHGIDSTDTQNRTYPGGIYPASLRQEAASGGELYWRKTDILTQIGYRLQQYNKLMISFRDTTDLPAPTANDIQDYKGFLNHGNFITPDEMRFLTATNDLITLDEAMLRGTDEYSEDLLTPMPRSAAEPEFPLQLNQGFKEIEKAKTPMKVATPVEPSKPALPPAAVTHLALAIFGAVLVPIFTFAVIPDFVGRITVVVLVAASVFSTLFQSGLIGLLVEDRGVLVMIFCAIIYGVVMATAAATFS